MHGHGHDDRAGLHLLRLPRDRRAGGGRSGHGPVDVRQHPGDPPDWTRGHAAVLGRERAGPHRRLTAMASPRSSRLAAVGALALAVAAVIVLLTGGRSTYVLHAEFSDAGQLVAGDRV